MNTENKMDFQEPKPAYGQQMKDQMNEKMCTHECAKLKEEIAELQKQLLQKTREFNYYTTSSSWRDYEERSKNWRDRLFAK